VAMQLVTILGEPGTFPVMEPPLQVVMPTIVVKSLPAMDQVVCKKDPPSPNPIVMTFLDCRQRDSPPMASALQWGLLVLRRVVSQSMVVSVCMILMALLGSLQLVFVGVQPVQKLVAVWP